MTPYVVAVLCPVLNRSHRVAPLIESVRAAAKVTPCRVVFIATEGDDDEIAAIVAAGDADISLFRVDPADDSYAKKINLGFRLTEEPFVFTAADDLTFHPGCFERLLATHLETGACVVGSNDLGHGATKSGDLSTHTLVCREYRECGTIDDPDSGHIFHEGYGHWQVDAELVGTAKARGTYAHAVDARVEHLHPAWGKAVDDDTYRRGQATKEADARLFAARSHLWQAR